MFAQTNIAQFISTKSSYLLHVSFLTRLLKSLIKMECRRTTSPISKLRTTTLTDAKRSPSPMVRSEWSALMVQRIRLFQMVYEWSRIPMGGSKWLKFVRTSVWRRAILHEQHWSTSAKIYVLDIQQSCYDRHFIYSQPTNFTAALLRIQSISNCCVASYLIACPRHRPISRRLKHLHIPIPQYTNATVYPPNRKEEPQTIRHPHK